MGIIETVNAMIDLAHLPPGSPALLLMIGGLALAVPVAAAMLLRPYPARAERRVARSVLVHPREQGSPPLPLADLTRIDQAIERVHIAGFGDARITHADATRKILRVTGCACMRGASCDETRAALERAIGEALGRRPAVTESACGEGRCEFVVAY